MRMKIGSLWIANDEGLIPDYLSFKKQDGDFTMSRDDIDDVIRRTDGVRFDCLIEHRDKIYTLVDHLYLYNWLMVDITDRRKYKKLTNDCDDFTMILYGHLREWDTRLATCIVWGYNPDGEYHSVVGYVNTRREFRLIEPQNDIISMDIKEWDVKKIFFI